MLSAPFCYVYIEKPFEAEMGVTPSFPYLFFIEIVRNNCYNIDVEEILKKKRDTNDEKDRGNQRKTGRDNKNIYG